MKYRKSEAKAYAKKNIKGLWGASLTPFKPDYMIDEDGFRQNIRHYIDVIRMDGMFINGLMGEAFHQTIPERKRIFKIAVEDGEGRINGNRLVRRDFQIIPAIVLSIAH